MTQHDDLRPPLKTSHTNWNKHHHTCILQNMVGPGEVDEELEPEVKEECETKYGDIIRVNSLSLSLALSPSAR